MDLKALALALHDLQKALKNLPEDAFKQRLRSMTDELEETLKRERILRNESKNFKLTSQSEE